MFVFHGGGVYGVCVVGVCAGGGVWGYGMAEAWRVGMGLLHLIRVMIISYFMTVICVEREGVVDIVIF